MTMISSIQNESGSSAPRAEIHERDGVYEVHYYSVGTTTAPIIERYEGHNVNYARDAAENWLDGIKQLNG